MRTRFLSDGGASVTVLTSGLRVLVVDDEPLLRWAIVETLREAGHQADEAATACEALDAAVHGPQPDVVLLDFRLPDSADFDLLDRLQLLLPDAAVLMISAQADAPEFVRAALHHGAREVIGKPLDLNGLPALVRHANSL